MLDNIMIFITLIEAGSFRKAAQILKVQHSTISKRMTQLEEHLGKRLLVRSSKDFSLTHDGQFIYERFKHISSYTDVTLKTFNSIPNSELEGCVSVSLPMVLSYEIICSHIGKFMENFPKIKLHISFHIGKIQNTSSKVDVENANKYLEKMLLNTDLILTTNNDINLPNFDYRFMRKESLKLYCSQEYAQTYGIPLNIIDLENHRFIGGLDHFTASSFDYLKFTNIHTNENVMIDNSKAQLSTNSALHIKKIAMNSNYIFGCWESLCIDEISNGTLIQILPEWSAHSLDFYLLTKKKLTPFEQEFVKFLYRCLGSSSV